MPMYTWRDKQTGYTIDILKTYEEYQVEPTDEDLPKEERGKERVWTKIIKKVSVLKAPGFGKKGYW